MTNARRWDKKIIRTPLLKIAVVLVLATPILLVLPTSLSAAASPIMNVTSGARTAPPPLEPHRHSLQSKAAQPVHIYQATNSLTRGEGLHAIVKTTTMTYKEMKKLSVNYRLERWTGTAWVTFIGSSSTDTKTNVLRSSSDWEVITGYYYRVVSIHTANDGTTSGQSIQTSPSVLF
ncbi:hypothetical protein PAECIP112173_01434 [Paenibacillus sp. JJ-100]|nr:hypothetical protein PAECIP112173_01434 [Paenibacillus sp. JJ-100]